MKSLKFQKSAGFISALFLIFASNTAYANVYIPVGFVAVGEVWSAFLFVLVVEAALLSFLLKREFFRSIYDSALANFVSSALGIPVSLFAARIVHGGPLPGLPAGLSDSEKWSFAIWDALYMSKGTKAAEGVETWMWEVAFITCLVLFFLASWLSESVVLCWKKPRPERRKIVLACLAANTLTYLGLALYLFRHKFL
ncbi:MAG: hypothetical protein IT560_03455 [Alphaproteobacteria bacterium]|nr:hypothetical protein [Alphaproteobacteria bacterium]